MEKGANPEELLAAAQSASFTMALVGLLEQSALMPQQIATEVEIQFEERKGIREIRRIDVCTEAMVPGISFSEFLKHAERALAICPISKALEATEIILHATLKMGIINEIIL
jgi:lipoyl-dependent peroxiredoxin